MLDGYDPYPEAQKKILKLCYTVPPHTSSVDVVWRQGEAGLRIYADAPHTDGPPTVVPVAVVYQPRQGTHERNGVCQLASFWPCIFDVLRVFDFVFLLPLFPVLSNPHFPSAPDQNLPPTYNDLPPAFSDGDGSASLDRRPSFGSAPPAASAPPQYTF